MEIPDRPPYSYGTYNVANALVEPAGADSVIEQLKTGGPLNDGVAICALQEALPACSPASEVRDRFARGGYDFYSINNWDADERGDARQTGLAIRHDLAPFVNVKPERMATRNLWRVEQAREMLGVPAVFLATHLDDRGNAARQVQFDALARFVETDKAIIIGLDSNVTEPGSPGAQSCATLGKLTRWLPETHPKKLSGNLPTPGRVRSIIRRLDEMTHSDLLEQFAAHGLHDTDPEHKPTMERMRFLKLAVDRLLVNDFVEVLDHQVSTKSVTDHRLVVATLRAV